MPKVLIISASFFDYQNSVARAFEQHGFQAYVENYDEPIHPFRGILRWRHKFSLDKERLREKSRLKYKKYIENIFDEIHPDIVFTYNGTILKDETLDYFRKNGAKVVVWMYDSVLRPDRAMCERHIDHADLFCCFEEKDVEYFSAQGKRAYFLPLACDTTVYYPQQSNKDIDILFVGTIYTSAKRIELLEKLVKYYSHLNIRIYGEYKPYFKNPLTWMFRKYRDVFLNHNITPAEVNNLYARSRIALNIHNKQTFCGANQRLFEASGARAYQICDANPYIRSVFPNGEVGLYENSEQLFNLIDYALTHDMSTQADKAYEIITQNHTFNARVKQIIEWLNQ